jgi:hypothetical protein
MLSAWHKIEHRRRTDPRSVPPQLTQFADEAPEGQAWRQKSNSTATCGGAQFPGPQRLLASCEQQENPSLRGQPVIVVQTLTDSAVAIAASYAAKAFGIKTGTLMRDARQLCPAVIPVQANHRLYTEYHERILKAVDTCLPVEKVCSIDEMACRLMGAERQVPVARELALKVKRALREQVGECLTCSIGIANGGALEHAQEMAAHESPRTTKLYDRTKERLTQDEVERIRL